MCLAPPSVEQYVSEIEHVLLLFFPKVVLSVSDRRGPVRGKSLLRGNKSTHQIEKVRNKKGSFLDQYVLDSSNNLRASLYYVEKTLEGVERSQIQGPFAKSDRQ